jgi:aromatic-L-amino-acid decarboxylase
MICPEFRHFWQGVEHADSVVFNPHKWLGANFDCSAHFLRDPDSLVRTLAIHPEFLKTHGQDGIINYSEWSVPLGRRFRALKIWFLLRAYGLEGLRKMIRDHVRWSEKLAARLSAVDDFRVVTGPMLSLFSFRHEPKTIADLDNHNLRLLAAINDDGRIYLTQTKVDGQIVIRFQAGSFDVTEADIDTAFDAIVETARHVSSVAEEASHG